MLYGVHLDNQDQPPESSFRRIRLCRAEVAVTLWTSGTRHRRGVYEDLRRSGVQRVCIRVGDEWIAGSVEDYLRDVDEAVGEAVAGGFREDAIDLQILNEPNLREFPATVAGAFVGNIVRAWRRRARPILTPLSRGVPSWRDYLTMFVGSLGELPDAPRACGAHVYRDDAEGIEPTGGKAMVISEFSHPDLSGAARGRWVVERLRDFARKGYGYACQFIVDGQDPTNAWPDNYVMTDAEAMVIGDRGTLPSPTEREPTEETPMRNPWAGTLAVVWNTPSDVGPMIALGRELGLAGFDLKIANGASSWAAGRVKKPQVDALKAAGFVVTGWAYDYADLAGVRFSQGDGVPELEARALAEAAVALGVDGVTLDLEIEVEGHRDLVTILIGEVRRLLPGMPLAAHTWADLDGHGGYPMDVISSGVDVVRPMCYRPVWNAQEMWMSLWPYLVGRKVAPVWGVTEGTLADIRVDDDAAVPAGVEVVGESYWEYEALANRRGELGDLVRSRFAAVPVVPEPAPEPPKPDPVAEALAGLDAAVARVKDALGRAA